MLNSELELQTDDVNQMQRVWGFFSSLNRVAMAVLFCCNLSVLVAFLAPASAPPGGLAVNRRCVAWRLAGIGRVKKKRRKKRRRNRKTFRSAICCGWPESRRGITPEHRAPSQTFLCSCAYASCVWLGLQLRTHNKIHTWWWSTSVGDFPVRSYALLSSPCGNRGNRCIIWGGKERTFFIAVDDPVALITHHNSLHWQKCTYNQNNVNVIMNVPSI